MGRQLFRASALGWLLLLAACGGGGDGPIGSGQGYLCAPGSIDGTNLACGDDVDCPCGYHCAVGLCAQACTSDADCAMDATCDPFGRCRDDGATLIAPEPETVGRVVVPPTSLDLDAAHPRGVLPLRVEGPPVAPVRVEADEGLLLTCSADAAETSRCTFDALSSADELNLGVRLVSEPTEGRVLGLRVFWADQVATVDVRALPNEPMGEQPLEGFWTGTASLVRAGSSARTLVNDTPETLRALVLPIEMRIYEEVGNRRVVTLSDIAGFVVPSETTVGELLRAGDGSLVLRYAPARYIEGEAEDNPIRVTARGESQRVVRGAAGLQVDLRTVFAGPLRDDFAPFVEWRLQLTRRGDTEDAAPSLPAAEEVEDPELRAARAFPLEAALRDRSVAELLALPGADRVQAIACSDTGGPPILFTGDRATPWSGDLGCADSAPRDMPRIFGPFRESTFAIAQTIGDCVADLERAEELREDPTQPFADATCVDAPRFELALAEAQAIDRARATGSAVAADLERSALAHRLVQQWAQLLGFVSSQAVKIDQLNDVLDTSSVLTREFSQARMLALTAAGWDVLLEPRVALPLSVLPGDVVLNPDYRVRLFPDGAFAADARQDLGLGLPVALARGLSRSLDAHGALLERARFVVTDRVEIESRSVSFARRSIVLFAFATLLRDSARSASVGDVPWVEPWRAASARFGVSLTGLVRALENLREGRNPLEIDPDLDLPLYRLGDETSSLSRFSALTDELLGTAADGDASQVAAAIADAEDALAAARDSYREILRVDLTYRISARREEIRTNAIREEFGEAIVSLCGGADLDADLIIEGVQPIDPATCWIREECRLTPLERLVRFEPGALAELLCMASELQQAGITNTSDPRLDVLGLLLRTGGRTVRGQRITEGGNELEVTTNDEVFQVQLDALLPEGEFPALDPDFLLQIQAECGAVASASEAARPTELALDCAFHGDCSRGRLCEEGSCVASSAADSIACFQGSVGETAAALRAAATDVEIARSEFADLRRGYEIQMGVCNDLIAQNERREEAIDNNLITLTALDGAQLVADSVAHIAQGVLDCSSNLVDSGGFANAVTCTSAGVAAVARVASESLQFAMDEVTRRHEANLASIDRTLEELNCASETERALVGMNTLSLRINRAIEEVSSLNVQLQNGQDLIAGNLAEGQEELANQVGAGVTPIEFDYFLDENVALYNDAFRRARRALYLGVLAYEYEYQLSSAEQSAVLAATQVSELRETLTNLRTLAATGTVNGAAPSDLFAVISLRDELLAIEDRSGLGEGMHTLTPEERFRVLLGASRHQSFDAEGNYLGQEIPFRLAPLPRVGGTTSSAIPLLTGADCAERLASMNASILGTDVLRGTDSTRTRITVRKRNSFFSQWCQAPVDGPAFQYAATRPRNNLFLDPFTDFIPGMRPALQGSDRDAAAANAFTSARLTPALNVPRAEFEDDSFFNGASRELAGRGVYGDYVLFIPAESIARDGRAGIDLEGVDDILLRVDYVSVAR